MSHTSALEYANSIAQQITEAVNSGYPFGVIDSDTDQYYTDLEDAYAQTDPGEARDSLTDASPSDYLSDVLDIQYIVNSDKSYRAARICIAFGGPTAWINTHTRQVEAAWWSETVYADLPASFCDQLDDWLAEYYECI